MANTSHEQKTLFGHPTGLYTLFFAEMWERFSFYGMRALLILYLIKGFLGYGDKNANAVYAAYAAMVYMTPFLGGLIADKLLGARATVVIGGVLMALGHLCMTIERELAFYIALGLLILGNGFFKPNISTIVGSLYPQGSPKRDGGFTIFYIGINLGAAMAPLMCGFLGETKGWHYGFGLATIGMIVGLAVFVAPTLLTQLLIFGTAVASAVVLLFYNAGDIYSVGLNAFVALALVVSGGAAVLALARGGLSKEAGGPPDPDKFFSRLVQVLVGAVIALPVFVLLASGFSVLPAFNEPLTVISEAAIEPLATSKNILVRGLATFVEEASRPAGLVLIIAGLIASGYLIVEALRMPKIARERMQVIFVLIFFNLVFWACFEQSGSSVNNFTDRNIDRVMGGKLIDEVAQVGDTLQLLVDLDGDDSQDDSSQYLLTQEFLGHTNGSDAYLATVERSVRWNEEKKEADKRMSDAELTSYLDELKGQKRLTMTALSHLRAFAKRDDATQEDRQIAWQVTEGNLGAIMVGGNEIPASVYQSVNPIFIMIFGLILSGLWTFLGTHGMEPSTPIKFSLGLIQLGAGFACLYFGAIAADANGMVGAGWLVLMYLLITTGELCLSPVGLSMVTQLAPARLVSTMMGAWFLATAFSHLLAGILAQFAAVKETKIIPVPLETVEIYGDLYMKIAVMGVASGVFCLALSPLLKKWMHIGEQAEEGYA